MTEAISTQEGSPDAVPGTNPAQAQPRNPESRENNGSDVRYVLFSHYAYKDGEKEDQLAFQRGTPAEELEGVQWLVKHLRGLEELLTCPGHQGMLVLFYAPGYQEFLDGLVRSETDERLMRVS